MLVEGLAPLLREPLERLVVELRRCPAQFAGRCSARNAWTFSRKASASGCTWGAWPQAIRTVTARRLKLRASSTSRIHQS